MDGLTYEVAHGSKPPGLAIYLDQGTVARIDDTSGDVAQWFIDFCRPLPLTTVVAVAHLVAGITREELEQKP